MEAMPLTQEPAAATPTTPPPAPQNTSFTTLATLKTLPSLSNLPPLPPTPTHTPAKNPRSRDSLPLSRIRYDASRSALAYTAPPTAPPTAPLPPLPVTPWVRRDRNLPIPSNGLRMHPITAGGADAFYDVAQPVPSVAAALALEADLTDEAEALTVEAVRQLIVKAPIAYQRWMRQRGVGSGYVRGGVGEDARKTGANIQEFEKTPPLPEKKVTFIEPEKAECKGKVPGRRQRLKKWLARKFGRK